MGVRPPLRPQLQATTLEADLKERVRGEVRLDAGSRALYSTDASNYRQVPIGVVLPRDVRDVIETMAVCRSHDIPVLLRGAATSLAGQTCNAAMVIDASKYLNRVLEIDPIRRQARVEPGVILDDLRRAAEHHHLTFGPDPATHNRCTLGGMIGNNACGIHSIMAGKTDDNVDALDILTYDGQRLNVGATPEGELERIIAGGGRIGEIYSRLKSIRDRYGDLIRRRFPPIPRRVSGYALEHLLPENGFQVARALVGTEGTCVAVLGATLRLVHSPSARTLVVLGYKDIYVAADQIVEIMAHQPIGLEGFDDMIVRAMRTKNLHPAGRALLPEGAGWLLVEFGGETRDEAHDRASALVTALVRSAEAPEIRVYEDEREAELVWGVREGGLGATAFIPGEAPYWPGWEDSAVPPERMADYLRELRALMDRYQYGGAFYGHFGHGCLHTRINFDLMTPKGISLFRGFMSDAADLVLRYGGSLSGEHGDGQARGELLPRMYGDELVGAFREFKAAWDPADRMNPGKVVRPYGMDDNLRLGITYHPAPINTHFQYPDDGAQLSNAMLRCVGVGKCRRLDAGTMCPSFMATREEKHSTRGRARLLFEMLQGEVIGKDGWRDESVKEALDLCLACKGCKGECPVRVDMATYKAEFMAHYYHGRLRPPIAYFIGFIYWWARLASLMPGLANFITQTPILSDLVKFVAGVAPARRIPPFAAQTFKQWLEQSRPQAFLDWARKNPPSDLARPRVILWADTFNNHLTPAVAQAAHEVLQAAGFQVIVPRESLCCGRPLYDFGFLDQAKALLRQVMRALEPEIRAGTPVVGLEPSCIAVFRDELVNLFPNDELARRLSELSFLFGEFMGEHAPGFRPPPLAGRAIVHGHCHQKALIGMGRDLALLDKLALDYRLLDSGCCGMAGAFGFERGEHLAVSLAAGERVLLPETRNAPTEALIIADGFSCREQIAQTTDRRALHLAQVLRMALRGGRLGRPFPEANYASRAAKLQFGRKAARVAGFALVTTLIIRKAVTRNRKLRTG